MLKDDCNTDVAVKPGGLTSVQPLDICLPVSNPLIFI